MINYELFYITWYRYLFINNSYNSETPIQFTMLVGSFFEIIKNSFQLFPILGSCTKRRKTTSNIWGKHTVSFSCSTLLQGSSLFSDFLLNSSYSFSKWYKRSFKELVAIFTGGCSVINCRKIFSSSKLTMHSIHLQERFNKVWNIPVGQYFQYVVFVSTVRFVKLSFFLHVYDCNNSYNNQRCFLF